MQQRPKQLVPIVVETKRVEPSAKYVANVESKEETGVVVEETGAVVEETPVMQSA